MSAIYQIAILLEFSVAVFNIQSSAYLFLAFLHICFGIGAFFACKHSTVFIQEKTLRIVFVLLAIFIILSFFSCLRIDLSAFSIIRAITLVCLCFTLFGIIFGVTIAYFNKNRENLLGAVMVCCNIGLILGFLLYPPVFVRVGVNAICLGLGISCAVLSFRSVKAFWLFAAAVFLIFAIIPVDKYLEDLRFKRMSGLRYVTSYFKPSSNFTELFNGWTMSTKLNIFRENETGVITGGYNYILAWRLNRAVADRARVPLGFIHADDRVLLIGCAAGQTGYLLPPGRTLSKRNTMMVEINSGMVSYFRDEHPEYNDHMFRRVSAVAADGRTVLNESGEKWDWIIVENMKFPSINLWMLDRLQTNMLTRECFQRCFHVLEDDGVMFGFLANSFYAEIVCSSLHALGIEFDVYKCDPYWEKVFFSKYIVYASRFRPRLETISAQLSRVGLKPVEVSVRASALLTDERPFISFITPQRDLILFVLVSGAVVMLLLGAGVIFCVSREMRGGMLYFFLIGTGFFLTQLYMLTRFGSFFPNPVPAMVAVNLIFLISVSAGNFFSKGLAIEGLRKNKLRYLGAAISIMALFSVSVLRLPYSFSGLFPKLIVAVAVIMPMGIFCGFFYPVGLRVNRDRYLGTALLLDGLGTCMAFPLFYAVSGLWGISANLIILFLAYLAAVILIISG